MRRPATERMRGVSYWVWFISGEWRVESGEWRAESGEWRRGKGNPAWTGGVDAGCGGEEGEQWGGISC